MRLSSVPATAHGPRPRAHRGLTLLELVVALTLTGIALATGYAAFGTLADRRLTEATRSNEDARASGIRRTLRDWIAGTRVVSGEAVTFRGLDDAGPRAFGEPANDEITFLTSARTPLGEGITEVRLFIDRSDSTTERGLVADLAEWRGTRTMRIQLAPEIEGLDARYLSDILGARQWLPGWVSNTVLPAAVELRLQARTGVRLHPLLALPATVPLEGGR
jgi:prepilin-type N-terminal cleavage/methylation domain-containing protein